MHYSTRILTGLFLLAASVSQGQNLVANSGFETGDFTGWTVLGEPEPTVEFGVGYTGVYASSFGAIAPDVNELSQMLSTQVGHKYALTFFAQTPEFNNPPGFPNSLAVYFDGSLIDGPFTVPDDPNYRQYDYTVTATSTTTLLRFLISNDPDYTQLDDIRVIDITAVPEPGPSILLLSSGIGGVWLLCKRHKRKSVRGNK